jgi:DMSO reductase anchor subunit
VYRATGRALWTGPNTVIRFGLTALLLGAAVTLLVTTTVAGREAMSATGALALGILALSVIKLGYEASLLAHLRALSLTALKRSAILMTTELKGWTIARFVAGALGGILLPLLLLHRLGQTGADGALVALSLATMLALLFAELAERTLFFSAVASRRMPGVGP